MKELSTRISLKDIKKILRKLKGDGMSVKERMEEVKDIVGAINRMHYETQPKEKVVVKFEQLLLLKDTIKESFSEIEMLREKLARVETENRKLTGKLLEADNYKSIDTYI